MPRSLEEKNLIRSKIHTNYGPLLISKLRNRGHSGMITRKLIQSLLDEHTIQDLRPEEISYLHGLLQVNFL